MQFEELLKKRRCIRSYTGEGITKEQAMEILDAGIRAPNSCNYQAWRFYATLDRKLIADCHQKAANIPWASDIPLLVVICLDNEVVERLQKQFGEERGKLFAYQDAAGAANHMLLKAADMGLGGCWIGPIDVKKCREHFSIPANHTPAAIITIGVPKYDKGARERRPLDEVVKFVGE